MDVELNEKTGVFPIRRFMGSFALGTAILGLALAAVAAFGSKFGVWNWSFGLGTLTAQWTKWILMVGAGLGLLALILALVIAPRKRRHIVSAALAIVISAGALLYGKHMRGVAGKLPAIHDVTTDTQNPPMFTRAIMDKRDAIGANPTTYVGKTFGKDKRLVSVGQSEAYPEIRPVLSDEAPKVLFGMALAAVDRQGWEIVTTDENAGIIEATDTTFWYGFKDDVVIRVRAGEGGGSILDARSISRVGGHDFGANAERLGAFLADVR